ncbi:hypothetical protein [Polyangium aurulentum]|uniref:hypothetical protein n=1 Tax=Polyangium aurulentum TaxID=2567896 RepID=UPI0010AE4DEF|nr:hypothetical protein [Polyangium aurulentum]UQA59981.1 hypothetical protein E8A73_005675 [Polyangium aurulentum]
MVATPFAPTKSYLLNLAHELWRRAADRMPPENILKYDEALIDALRTLKLPQPTEEASVYEAEMALSVEALNTCFDGQLALIGLPRWAQCGYPEIQLPETYAAALLATVVPDGKLGSGGRDDVDAITDDVVVALRIPLVRAAAATHSELAARANTWKLWPFLIGTVLPSIG